MFGKGLVDDVTREFCRERTGVTYQQHQQVRMINSFRKTRPVRY